MRGPRWYKLIWPVLSLCVLLTACGGGNIAAADPPGGGRPSGSPAQSPAAPETPADSEAPEPPKETRPNTPQVLVPETPGELTLGAEPLVIDYSRTGQGYVTVQYSGTAAKACVQITGPDGVTYKYFLPPAADYVTLPLTGGSGAYALDGYENIQGSEYAVLFKESVEVQLEDELLPFLYPNQYVDFNADSAAVAKAQEIVAQAENDLDAVSLIYHYIIENISYDQAKADSVSSGYLPVVDDTLATGTGICFDYASLTAAMLRSQRIPAKLEIGYAGTIYHAWVGVYLEEVGWVDHLIEFTGDAWTRMDPTFAAGNGNSEEILKYIGDGSNYQLQYAR